jgi:cytochrome c-type biogenesis protein CcmF
MGLSSYSRWREQDNMQIWRSVRNNAALSIIIALGLLWGVSSSMQLIPIVTLTLSIWIMLSILPAWRLMPSMSLAHTGFAILIIGIMLSSTLNQERNVRVKTGDSVSVGPYQFIFLGIQGINGSNYRGIQAGFDVTKGDRHIVNLYPEKRIYTVRDMVMTKVAIHAGIFRDLYIALGQPLDNDEWTVRIYYKPFIRWIWAGGILMMLGGLLSIVKRART